MEDKLKRIFKTRNMGPFRNVKKKAKRPGIREEIQKPKTEGEILREEIELGLREYHRSRLGLLLSAFSAGLEIGFSVYLMGMLHHLYSGVLSEQNLLLLMALAYPVGFIFVTIGRSELFTEHTTLAVLPVLNKSVGIKDMLALWGIIYAGNLLGGYVFAVVVGNFAPVMNSISKETFTFLARSRIDYTWPVILGSSIGAGWLMGILSWLVASSQDTISRIFIIIIVTVLIGLGGLHHSIVGSIEVFTGLLSSKSITLADYLHFQFWATIGNAIGGIVFVAIIKYSHTKRS